MYKELQYEKAKEDDFIMKQDELGYTYYIILRGKVAVLINLPFTATFKYANIFRNFLRFQICLSQSSLFNKIGLDI